MSTISNNFSFSKEWTDADDFPTKEYSEPQVRADIQQLFDELKDYINNVVVAGINDNASSIAALGGGGQVDTNSLADDCVTAEKIKDGEITELKYADDSIPYRALQEECVHNINIQDGAVTAEKLGNSAVTTAKLDNGSVTVDKMATNSVSAAKILDNAVITSKINNGAVTADKLASNSVTTAKIVDGNVTTGKIADLGVTTGKIANSGVTTAKIADGNVTADKLASNSVTAAKIKDGEVTTAKIADLNVTTGKIANSGVTTAKIADGNVTAAKLASNSVTTAKITNGNVTAEKLDSSTVDPYVNGLIDAKATALAPVRGVKGNSESSYRTGNVNITKANIGLGNVENKSSETIRGEITDNDISTALGFHPSRFAAVRGQSVTVERGQTKQVTITSSQLGYTPVPATTVVSVIGQTSGAKSNQWSMAIENGTIYIEITNDNISGSSGGDNTDPFYVTVYYQGGA